MGRGGGRVVSVLVLYPDDPSSNPPEANNSFDVKYVFERSKVKIKGPGWPNLKTIFCKNSVPLSFSHCSFSLSNALDKYSSCTFPGYHTQCQRDQMLKLKVAQFSSCCPASHHSSCTLKSAFFKITPKCHRMSQATFIRKCVAQIFKKLSYLVTLINASFF